MEKVVIPLIYTLSFLSPPLSFLSLLLSFLIYIFFSVSSLLSRIYPLPCLSINSSTQPTRQLINPLTHQHLTHQPINLSIHQPTDPSTYQPTNPSTLLLICLSLPRSKSFENGGGDQKIGRNDDRHG